MTCYVLDMRQVDAGALNQETECNILLDIAKKYPTTIYGLRMQRF